MERSFLPKIILQKDGEGAKNRRAFPNGKLSVTFGSADDRNRTCTPCGTRS